MSTSPKLALEFLSNGAANQTLANLTFAQLDQLVQAVVIDKDLTSPPGSPANGSLYIVASGSWGTASSKTNQLTYWLSDVGAWTFIVPMVGWRVAVLDELDSLGIPKIYAFTGSSWAIPENIAVAAPSAVVNDSSTSRSASLTDAGSYIRFSNAASVEMTVPAQASVPWGADTEIHVRRANSGNLTLTPAAGVILNAPSGGTLVLTENMTATLKRVASNEWDIIGQTVPQ